MAVKTPKERRQKVERDEDEVFDSSKMMRFMGWAFLVVLGIEAILWYPLDFNLDRYTVGTFLFCVSGAGLSFGVAAQMANNLGNTEIVKNQFRNWLFAIGVIAVLVMCTYAAYMFGDGPINHP
ncbi:MAG: hypothetical protein ACTSU5_20180 [Promethearchaeota archaeon]